MAIHAFEGVVPAVAPSAWVAPSADLIGDVRVGEGASVWFAVVVRADNTPILIGRDANVQDGSVLHSDPGAPLSIGEGCTIGHRAILHGCTLGRHVLIGMGAIVMNHAAIGDESIVGAGALVSEGKSFPPRSLILGVPARLVRALDDAAVAGLADAAASYVAKRARYAAGLG